MTHWCGCENTAKGVVKHQLINQIKVVNEHFRTIYFGLFFSKYNYIKYSIFLLY